MSTKLLDSFRGGHLVRAASTPPGPDVERRPGTKGEGSSGRGGAGPADARKPWPVPLVTAGAMVLPGLGQLLNGDPTRGIVMQFFMMLLALITYMVTSPDISIFGRFAGGAFIYVISVLDAYQVARRRSAAWSRMSSDAS